MTWTPRAPAEIGLPWFPVLEPSTPLDGELIAAAAVLDSTVTETIGSVWVNLASAATSTPNLDGWELEVYDTGSLAGGDVSSTVYRPSRDGWNVDMAGWNGAAVTSNLYNLINESSAVASTYNSRPVWDQDWISPTFGRSAECFFYYGSIVGTLTGRHILAVTVRAYAQELVDLAQPAGVTITPYLRYNGVKYPGQPVTVTADLSDYTLVEHTWYACPWTGAGWKIADIEAFDDNVSYRDAEAGWAIGASGSSNIVALIYRGELEVHYGATDPRVIVGTLRTPERGWAEIDLLNKATGASANWSKLTGARYLLILRRRTGTGFVHWRYLDSGETMPHVWQSGRPGLDKWQRPEALRYADVGRFGDLDRTACYGVLLERSTGGIISVDSQPYISINDDRSGVGGFDNRWTHVHASQTIDQEITTDGSGGTYGYLQSLIAIESEDTTDDLTVTLRATAAPGVVLATATISPSELESPETRFQRFGTFFDGGTTVALSASTQYFLRFACPATSGSGWRVQVLSASLRTNEGGPPTGVGRATMGGTTDLATVEGVTYEELDVAVTLHTLPTAPANFAAAVAGEIDCIDYVELTWTATALGDDFLRYEIERSDGGDWECVRRITDEATASWDDYLAPRNVASQYRIRVVRADRAPSLWSTSAGVTPTMECCGYIFAVPGEALWYDDLAPRTYEFLENVETIQLHGRDFQVALRETEDRGDRFKATLVIAADGAIAPTQTPAIEGRRNFDDLLVLCGNKRDPSTGTKTVPDFVAVLDRDGNRWLASVQTPQGVREEPEGHYLLDVIVTEIAATPTCSDDPIITEGS